MKFSVDSNLENINNNVIYFFLFKLMVQQNSISYVHIPVTKLKCLMSNHLNGEIST